LGASVILKVDPNYQAYTFDFTLVFSILLLCLHTLMYSTYSSC